MKNITNGFNAVSQRLKESELISACEVQKLVLTKKFIPTRLEFYKKYKL